MPVGTVPITAGVAVWALRSWRTQLKAKAEYRAARRLLKASYLVRDAITQVRYASVWAGEQSAALRQAGLLDESASLSTAKLQGAVYQRRWLQVQRAMRRLDMAGLEAEVLWGADAAARVGRLHKLVMELNVGISTYLMALSDPKIDPKGELCEHSVRLVFSMPITSETRDYFHDRVLQPVKDVEDYLRPHLKLQG